MNGAGRPQLPYRRILMTGGTGFVGRYLAPCILQASRTSERLMISRSKTRTEIAGWPCVAAEIDNHDKIDSIVGRFRPDLVIHMAAQASVGVSRYSVNETWETNFGGSNTIARAVAKHCPDAVVLFASSAEVYGLSFNSGKVDETAPLQPVSSYARSKIAAEYVLSDLLPSSVRLIIARPFNHLGVGQDERFVIPSFVNQIVRIEAGIQPPAISVGNLDAERDFLDVRDVCQAYLELLGHTAAFENRVVFNICSGRATKVSDALDMLRSQARCHFDVVVDENRLRPNDIPFAVGKADRLQALTGWIPRKNVAQTIAEILKATRASLRPSPG